MENRGKYIEIVKWQKMTYESMKTKLEYLYSILNLRRKSKTVFYGELVGHCTVKVQDGRYIKLLLNLKTNKCR